MSQMIDDHSGMTNVHGLAGLDANLLVTLDVLLAERNVTRAAERVGVTQSAMSHTLRRLRDLFGDPLLVRGKGEMVLTPRAEALVVPLRSGLVSLARAIAPPVAFDPATASRVFRIASPDLFDLIVLPRLLARVRAEAPGVDLVFVPLPRGEVAEALMTGELDLAIVPVRMGEGEATFGPVTSGDLMRRVLFRDSHRVFVRREHPAMGKRGISRKKYVGLPHVLVSPAGAGVGLVDEALARVGLRRRVALRVPNFATAAEIVAGSDLVLTAPGALGRVEALRGRMSDCAVPVEMEGHALTMVWHPRFGEEAGARWLRGVMVDVSGGAG